ncbi:unnamed protein product [Cuscuta europaea]|uniref:Uncharacterized protein n=1 Tax=Cuscuta europaea TaxID=41803 RepID=A0A9P0YQG0_CUSEU|nr:unnamed protein product [Cuscuta europaea]
MNGKMNLRTFLDVILFECARREREKSDGLHPGRAEASMLTPQHRHRDNNFSLSASLFSRRYSLPARLDSGFFLFLSLYLPVCIYCMYELPNRTVGGFGLNTGVF